MQCYGKCKDWARTLFVDNHQLFSLKNICIQIYKLQIVVPQRRKRDTKLEKAIKIYELLFYDILAVWKYIPTLH